jgi:uncharacterized repeat protein (TIGR04052 family)
MKRMNLAYLGALTLVTLGFSACTSGLVADDNFGGTSSGGRNSGGSAASGGKGSGGAGVGGEGGSPVELDAVTLSFRAQFDDAPFACGQKYSGQGSTKVEVTPQDLRLYVSELALLTVDGDEVPVQMDVRSPWQVREVALLDFEDATGACKNGNEDLNSKITGRVPPGEYVGVRFSTAVPKSLNHEDPAKLPEPLQAGGMTWGWLFGYKFIRAEVMATAAPADEEMPGMGLFHLGSTGCDNTPSAGGGAGGEGGAPGPDYEAGPSVDCSLQNRNSIQLDDFDPQEDAIVIDVEKMMSGVDLSLPSMCHGMGDACGPMFESVGVDLMTGEASEGQTVFRVEPR